jgi:radical SAM superfamily enzyme YgiQ (UPF0313 family)
MKILLVGIYDTNTVSLAPHILRGYAEKFNISSKFQFVIREFSIFSNPVESVTKAVKEEKPDVVGFSVYIWNFSEVLEIIKHIDAVNILGGPQVSGIEHELIEENPNIDIVVTGEGEVVFKELLEYLAGEKRIDEINGITTRDIKTESPNALVDLDSIPSVYDRILREFPDISWISFESSRGCPMGCNFCTWGYQKKMRYYSLGRVFMDLDLILSHDKIKYIYFCDSSLLYNKKRAKQILQHIIDSTFTKPVRYEFSAEQLDDEIIDLLIQLPSHEFNFGIQSTNKRAFDAIGRKFNKDRFEENYFKIVKKFRDPNITVDLIYGLPDDDIEGYKESLDYVISLDKVKRILTNPLVVLPGSELYRNMDKYGISVVDKKSYIIKENRTFSKDDMELARKYSFFVSIIYLNYRLRDSLKLFAEWKKKKYIKTIIEFMESSPIVKEMDKYPDMIPSAKDGFKQRNRAFQDVINRYDFIVDCFREFSLHKYDSELLDYENCYSDHFYKLKGFTGEN